MISLDVEEAGTGGTPGADYEVRFQVTRREWMKFIRGETIDGSVIPAEIADSWLRCRQMRVDPLKIAQHRILAGDDLRELLARNSDLITTSRPFMENMYQFVKGTGFFVGLFDAEGYIVGLTGDDEVIQRIPKGGLVIGALWDERSAGNNSVGTVMTLKKPVQIFGAQHYLRMLHRWTDSSAPIFGPDGTFLGGISLTGHYSRVNPHTLGMTVAAAHAIENSLQTKKALAGAEMASSYQKTVISSIPEALITLDNRGVVSLLNENARKMFSLEPDSIGKYLRDIFSPENRRFFGAVESSESVTDAEVRIFSRDTWNDYTLTCNPILSPDNETIGKILILNEIRRAKTMVTRMIGAKANYRFEDICGRNPRFLMTVDQARMVSRSSSNVLLLGRSGTGKDLFAQAIHNESDRRDGPYVAINCGAIPRDLITSELFGYEEGAFTGSRRGGNQGKFELADTGTIFLDEIAEIPLELQTALLRVIEDKSIVRLGGTRVRPVDVRIIAATNKDLREEVRKGNFREDLYYRANVFAIDMVPLRERPDDIPLLVDCFVRKYERAMVKKIDRIDEKVLGIFTNYPWPGNVRELQNTIERMMNFVLGRELTVDLVPSEIAGFNGEPGYSAFTDSAEKAEKNLILRMLGMKMRKYQIARDMKISRVTLYRKMKKYGLS